LRIFLKSKIRKPSGKSKKLGGLLLQTNQQIEETGCITGQTSG
jgi:hypothetical protein